MSERVDVGAADASPSGAASAGGDAAVGGAGLTAAEVRRLGEELVEVGWVWTSQQRRLVLLASEFDRSGGWAADNAASCAHWIAAALEVEVSTAREWLRIGHRLAELREVDAAFAERRLSYSKVRALSRIATPENEVELCELAERVPAGRLPSALAAWLQRSEEPEETERRQFEQRYLTWRLDSDGTVSGSFRLPPLVAGAFISAIDAEVMGHRPEKVSAPETPANASADASADALAGVVSSPNGSMAEQRGATATGSDRAEGDQAVSAPSVDARRWPSFAQQRADALVRLVGTCQPAESESEASRSPACGVNAEVVVHVRGDGCTLDDGTPVADSAVARLLPEAFVRVLIHDAERRPINASGRQRHPTTRQKRVVKERDQVCVECGGGGPFEFDHVPPFEQSRRTVVGELKILCVTCHRAKQSEAERRRAAARSKQRSRKPSDPSPPADAP